MNIETNSTNGTSKTKSSKVIVKAAKVTTQPDRVEIFDIEKRVVELTLVGTSDLIVNNFNEKSIQQMEDERRLDAEGKRALKKAPRTPVIPEERYLAARILDEEGRDCVPARWLKAALVTAATKYGEIGVPGTVIRGALFVLGDLLPIKYKGVAPWAELKPLIDGSVRSVPVMRRDVVRVGSFPNKKPDLRYRPSYRDWSIDIRIEFEPALISLAGLHHLVRRAGTSVGFCEWRPEKSPAGVFGRFDIKGV